jgi:hypothetical protein
VVCSQDDVVNKQFDFDWARLRAGERFSKFVRDKCAKKEERDGALDRLEVTNDLSAPLL